ncbi:MAG TPA: HD domain-containing protein [Nitrososphaeria archaeon]|nr:HD domain-containing protein [Nitrososphaeria archaeon]
MGPMFKLIKDPVHGYIEVSEDELKVIDTYAVQRLRRITQLPFVYLVYPGARHSRFDHSLGCMYLAGEFAKSLGLDEYRRKVMRLAGLLHDIGHAPYSHLFETLLEESGSSHELMTARILREDEELAEAIEECGVSVKDVLEVLEGEAPESTVISGPIDADKLDFLLRDAYFTGAPYGLIDVRRIILRSRLMNGKLAVNINAVGAVEEMALARYQNFMNIYFHHTARAAQILFLSGARIMDDVSRLSELSVREYLGLDDYVVWCAMKSDERTSWIIDRIERRKIPKVAFELRLREEDVPREVLEHPEEAVEKVASLARVPENRVWIDTPYITSLPFKESGKMLFYEDLYGELKPVDYSSPLLEFTSKIYGIIRVYTDREFLDRVRRASEKYFGGS